MDKGGMCEKRRSEDSEESDEEIAGFWLISLCKLKSVCQLLSSRTEV